ncbi:MAG: ParB/RepB/Spo0J family partition protein [Ruminococcus sp.]|nr:ParB/RepB/Spo0J family partition protein [Ruminococcus sp.]
MTQTTFNLGAMLSTSTALQNAVKQIPCEMLIPYHNHKFGMYSGERLEDMIESIKENGILSPIIVQPAESGKYEILIGHNRWNACKIAGLQTVPAIIKEGLSEEEAEMYVIESNLMQRGFSNLKISEQAEVIAMRYDKMFSQGKRNDIIRELQLIENPDSAEEPEQPKSSREKVGEEYGLSRNSVARLVRVSKLIDSLKELVDNGTIAVRTAVNLSYLSEQAQSDVADLATENKIDMKKSEQLKANADENGDIPHDTIIKIIIGIAEDKPKPKSVKISNDTFIRYFESDTKSNEITETIEKALEFYFANAGKDEI